MYIYNIHICTHTHICLYTHPHMCMYIIHTNIYRFQFLARPWRHLQRHLSSGAMLRSCHVFFFGTRLKYRMLEKSHWIMWLKGQLEAQIG